MNQLLIDRLGAIRRGLVNAHGGGVGMSSATMGREREHFVSTFLGNVLPTPLRVGSGDIIDSRGGHSGQLDTVVEYPYHPSFPMMSGAPRLYVAEGVAAVVEVKSSLDTQWNEVRATADKVKPLRRVFGGGVVIGGNFPSPEIPLVAVGYTGWKKPETILAKAQEGPADAILVLDVGLCATRSGATAGGDMSLLLLMEYLRSTFAALVVSHTSLLPYAQ